MKIRMRTTAAGPNGVWPAEKEVEVSDKEGRELINRGYADEIKTKAMPIDIGMQEPEKEPEKETASLEPATETTAQPDPSPRTKRRPRRRIR